jgi:hypothetical protein
VAVGTSNTASVPLAANAAAAVAVHHEEILVRSIDGGERNPSAVRRHIEGGDR